MYVHIGIIRTATCRLHPRQLVSKETSSAKETPQEENTDIVLKTACVPLHRTLTAPTQHCRHSEATVVLETLATRWWTTFGYRFSVV